MNKKIIIALLVLSTFGFMSACTKTGTEFTSKKEISFNDGFKNGELYLNDSAMQAKVALVTTAKDNSLEAKKSLPDRSEVETMTDGFGNKTETRTFKDHSRLRFIIIRTATDGTKTVTVYGYDGDTKILDNFDGDPMTAQGDEIANAAKLYVTKTPKDPPPNFLKKKSIQPLQGSQSPIQQQTDQQQPSVAQEPQSIVEKEPQEETN